MKKRKYRIDENGFYTSFSEESDAFLKENYLTMPLREIEKHIPHYRLGITTRLKQLGLEVPKEILEKRRKDSLFKSNHIPHNKGKKLEEWLSPENIVKLKSNCFQKGLIPHNTYEDYTESIWTDSKTGRKYIKIKIPNRKRLAYKHIWLWEEKNGKVKKGYVVAFKDGNTLNCDYENLEMISMQENLLRNSKNHNYPTELIPKYAKLAQIKKLINNLEKN